MMFKLKIHDSNVYIGVFFDSFPRMEQFEKGYKDPEYRKAIDEWNDLTEIGSETIDNRLDFQASACNTFARNDTGHATRLPR